LTGYLEEISLVLRQGGWEKDDISDMIDSETAPDLWNQQIDAQAVLATLVKEVELLPSSLKKAVDSVQTAIALDPEPLLERRDGKMLS
jgi:hypothetical protein